MTKENRYYLGKCDYNKSGRKNCKAFLAWRFSDGVFAMHAEIWNPRETDWYAGGQCVDTVAAYFPADKKAQEMVRVWQRWHLNDMNAGSPAQRAYLETQSKETWDYTRALAALTAAGLSPDPNYPHKGEPYVYGSAWLREEIPADVAEIIERWAI
jgi:hypothetical protein